MIRAMIEVVFPQSRFEHASALMQMHHDRKRVFVDRLGWSLASRSSWLEVDDFDNDSAVYLLARDPATGRHMASVRLLPTTGPHMLSSLFPNLCACGVPAGEDCWEISRFLTCPPEVEGTSVVRLHRLLAIGLIEFALMKSISRYTLVTEAHRVPALLSIGWLVMPLGLATPCAGETLQALEIRVEEQVLARLRRKAGICSGVLQFTGDVRVAA